MVPLLLPFLIGSSRLGKCHIKQIILFHYDLSKERRWAWLAKAFVRARVWLDKQMISVIKITENDTDTKQDSKLFHVPDDMIGQHGS